jgi:hypothetical protein
MAQWLPLSSRHQSQARGGPEGTERSSSHLQYSQTCYFQEMRRNGLLLGRVYICLWDVGHTDIRAIQEMELRELPFTLQTIVLWQRHSRQRLLLTGTVEYIV